MLEEVTKLIVKEINNSIAPAVKLVKRNILFFLLKGVFLILSVVALLLGLVLLSSKYVGLDLALLTVGIVMFLAFLLLK